MAEPLKNIYTPEFFDQFAATLKKVKPSFKPKDFLKQIFDDQWKTFELKQRMRHIAAVLNKNLPGNYKDKLTTVVQIIEAYQQKGVKGGFEYMFLPDFIEQFGMDDFERSLEAMETVTQFASCEFAIRPFLLKHQQKVMKQMLKWSKHPHPHVRRFASEGCRPRLPWAMAVPALKKEPSPILPILENLKDDPSLFVRKSVANNLNDIAKDHPDIVAAIAKQWKGHSNETDWIIRHGCRTLLKKAHPATHALFGLHAPDCEIVNLKLNRNKLTIGDRLGFSFELKTGKKTSKLRLEYAVYYVKAGNKLSRKIFQLTERNFEPSSTYSFKKEQRFEDFTTRRHYPGNHKIAIVVNGKEMALKHFDLVKSN